MRLLQCRPLSAKCLMGLFLLFMLPALLQAQSKTITGTVTDDAGKPAAGISVTIKNGKNIGTTTGTDGKFSINAAPGVVLVFSSVGFETVESTVGSKATYNISLKKSTSTLNDVVVVGYGTVKRKDLTGSIGSVNMKDAHLAPVKSFDEFLAGRVAGVAVSSNDGQPGSVANIVIRGTGSITQNTGPLYVIDGVPLEDGQNNSIPPENIETFDVLKDASATAIYGARGANGVIIITTKRGKPGPPQVSYNGYYGIQKIPKKVKLMNLTQFIQYASEVNKGAIDSTYLKSPYTLASYDTMPSLDLQDQIYQTGLTQNNDIAVRGGSENTRYSLSLNYLNQKGIIITSGFSRYQGRLTLDQKIGDKLRVGLNANYSVSQTKGYQVNSVPNAFYGSTGLLYKVWGWTPGPSLGNGQSYEDLLDDALNQNNINVNNQSYIINPVKDLQATQQKNSLTNLNAIATVDYAITKKLNLHVDGSVVNSSTQASLFNNLSSVVLSNWFPNGTYGNITNSPSTTWNNSDYLVYTTAVNEAHHISGQVGFNAQGVKSSYRYMSGTQLPNPDLGLDGLGLAPAPLITTNNTSNSRASVFGRVSYDYKSKYYFTGTYRADASSRFAPAHRWGYFPSGAVKWRFTNEDFFKDIKFISDGGLRVSYGASGNDRVSDLGYLPTISLTNFAQWQSYNNNPAIPGATVSNIGNLDLKWETAYQTNIGIDLSLFKNLLNLTVDLYRKKSKDLILNANIPLALGIGSATGFKNVGNMQNQGLEITLGLTNVQTKDFSWSSNFNIGFNQNKIVALTDNQPDILTNVNFDTRYSGVASPYISLLNQPVGQFYGLQSDGLYQLKDFDLMPNGTYLLKPNITDQGGARTAVKPGFAKYKDINGDLHIDQNDFTVIGRGQPLYTGGFSNNFSYKGFSLNVLLQYNVGNDLINANKYMFNGGTAAGNPYLNQYASYADRWSVTNQNSSNYVVGGDAANAYYSSRVVEDGSYLKLRTVALSYDLPKLIVRKMGISRFQVYASAQNIYTWTHYSGPDPEVSTRNSALTPGFDYSAYPHSLTVTAGVNVSF